jgi:hypothetical protein
MTCRDAASLPDIHKKTATRPKSRLSRQQKRHFLHAATFHDKPRICVSSVFREFPRCINLAKDLENAIQAHYKGPVQDARSTES